MDPHASRFEDQHGMELRDARDEATSFNRLIDLTESSFGDVRLVVAERYATKLARELLRQHLSNGALVSVQMTNLYRCLDSISIGISLDGLNGYGWAFSLADPELNGDFIDSSLFFGIVGGRTAPDGVPYWTEFEFRNSCPDWDDIENMMGSNGYEELLQVPPSWPQPLNGHDYKLWALCDLQSQASVDPLGATKFLRRQEGLIIVGSAEVQVRADFTSVATGQPNHFGNADEIIHMLRYLKSGEFDQESSLLVEQLRLWTHEILEPMLVALPYTPQSVLGFISEDLSSPAMNVMRICPWIPEKLRSIATLATPTPLYTKSFFGALDAHNSFEGKFESSDLTYSRRYDNNEDTQLLVEEVNQLHGEIRALVPGWREDHDELSIEFLIQSHKQFLQFCFWSGEPSEFDIGPIGIKVGTLSDWRGQLATLLSSLESDESLPQVEAIVFESWLNEKERRALRSNRESLTLMDLAQGNLVEGNVSSARVHIQTAIEAGSVDARYLLALVEARHGTNDDYLSALSEAVDAGNMHALGDLAAIQLAEGNYEYVIKRLLEVPRLERTSSVWGALAWAMLMNGTWHAYLKEIDDHALEILVHETAPFRLSGQLQKQLNFFANHFHCAIQLDELTDYEQQILEYVVDDHMHSEITIIAAYASNLHGDVYRRDQLLRRLLNAGDISQLREEFLDALINAPSESQVQSYFANLLSLLDLVEQVGSIHALGGLSSELINAGKYDQVIERILEVPRFARNAETWAPLAWAMLMKDRCPEFLQEINLQIVEQVIQDHSPLGLSGEFNTKLNFLTNYFHCVVQDRKLTDEETRVLESIVRQYESPKITLIAAYVSDSFNEKNRCDELLSGLTVQDVSYLTQMLLESIAESPKGSHAESYFNRLLTLLKSIDNLTPMDIRLVKDSSPALLVRELIVVAYESGVLQVRNYMHESIGISMFIFLSQYTASDGSLVQFRFGFDNGNRNPDIEAGISSEWLYQWLLSWGAIDSGEKAEVADVSWEIRSNGWGSIEAPLDILMLMTTGDSALTDKGREVLARWFLHKFDGWRENMVCFYDAIPPQPRIPIAGFPDLEVMFNRCWEVVYEYNPVLAQVVVGPILMLLPSVSDDLKRQVIQAGVPDALDIAKTLPSISDSVRFIALSFEEQGIGNQESLTAMRGKLVSIPAYAFEDQSNLKSTFGPIALLIETLISDAQKVDSFPTFEELGLLISSNQSLLHFHRDVVLASLVERGWMTVGNETRVQVQRTLQSLNASMPRDLQYEVVNESWLAALALWDELDQRKFNDD